jgi:hypothetical protein
LDTQSTTTTTTAHAEPPHVSQAGPHQKVCQTDTDTDTAQVRRFDSSSSPQTLSSVQYIRYPPSRAETAKSPSRPKKTRIRLDGWWCFPAETKPKGLDPPPNGGPEKSRPLHKSLSAERSLPNSGNFPRPKKNQKKRGSSVPSLLCRPSSIQRGKCLFREKPKPSFLHAPHRWESSIWYLLNEKRLNVTETSQSARLLVLFFNQSVA